ncbi:transcriptional regulator, LysR family [Anaeromyxobacter dehalogenans 2CP-C]|uniref:Transcriptional regulator, LysR family n=2 Tax=Anaeromyxobacter dehalogenans TaxID=161493 RepID=Q2IE89_ANADE|nr:transcriptional regulator, LysR family [Anaeromyxobacter dehalogenans 2CP-C]
MLRPMDEMIDPGDLRLFVAVAQQSSFVGASRRTGVPTSTVSRAVARLEERLGVRLLHRTSRRVSATDEGARLLARAAPLLEQLRDLLEDAADREEEPTGRLRVTAPVVTGAERVGRALIAYAAAHPRVSVDLRLTNSVLSLVEEAIDLAFRVGPVAEADVVARRLWAIPSALAASPEVVARELGGRRRVDAAALARAPAVVTHPGRPWRFRGADGVVRELTPNERFAATDPRVAVEAALAGIGVVRAPAEMIARAGGLVVLECALGEPEGRELFAVYPSRRLVPRRVRDAIEWVRRTGPGGSDVARRRRPPG